MHYLSSRAVGRAGNCLGIVMWIVLFGIKSGLAAVCFAARLVRTAVSRSEPMPALDAVDA
jgi:hypothetical protein